MNDASRPRDERLTSQDDVDALIESPGWRPRHSASPETRDIDTGRSQTEVVAEMLPRLNENFARKMESCISGQFMVPVTMTPRPVRVLEFSRFMDGIPLPSSLHVVTVYPEKSLALIVLEPNTLLRISALYNNKKGWDGQPKIEGREFTVEEKTAARAFLNWTLCELANVWEQVGPFQFLHQHAEQDPGAVKAFFGQELVVHSPFELVLGECVGMLHVVINHMLPTSVNAATDEEVEDKRALRPVHGQPRPTHETQSTEEPNFDDDKASGRP